MSVADASRLPLVDLRAWARVFPRQRGRDVEMRGLTDLEKHWRVQRLTDNPHFECDPSRGICFSKPHCSLGRGAR